MELIEPERKSEQGALPEPEPRYKSANLPVKRNEHGQSWIRIIIGVVLGVILVILIVLLARWIYHKAHNHATPPTPSVSQNTPALSSNNSKTNTAPGASSNSNVSNNAGTSSNTSSGSSGSSPNSQTPNTGPGNVAAIFTGASLAAAGLHYLISVRRFAKKY